MKKHHIKIISRELQTKNRVSANNRITKKNVVKDKGDQIITFSTIFDTMCLWLIPTAIDNKFFETFGVF